MSPRKPASEELTKELIIYHARQQFVEKDFQQVSMRSIARELGCSHGALYYHFNNKADLFYAIVESDFSALDKRIDEIVKRTTDNHTKLYQLFLGFIEFGLNNQSQYEIMFMMRTSEVDGLSQQAASQCYQHFAQSVHNLTEKEVTIKNVWSAFLALHGFVSHHRGSVSCFEEAKLSAIAHVNFVLKGLRG